jgi:hypothetical protein
MTKNGAIRAKAGARISTVLPPLPPRFARSPSPAENAGEDEDVASLDLATAANLAAK